jgi:hypothetical protein
MPIVHAGVYDEDVNHRVGWAWLALCGALALHVFDEATTGFLEVYNPTAEILRARYPWFPMPTFRFEAWLSGLILAIVAMLAAAGPLFRGAPWTRPVAYALAVLMIANALGHTAGTLAGRTVESVRFSGPMPGFYSSPFLLAASLLLLFRLRAPGSRG